MSGYKSMMNAFALAQVAQVPDIPAADLAIGGEEIMYSIGVFVPTNYIPIQQRLYIPTGAEVSFEDMNLDGTDATLEATDFIITGAFYGDWVNRGY